VKRSRVAIVLAVLAVAALASCTDRPPRTPPGKTPVIFVHGYLESGAMWDVAVSTFTAAGYEPADLVRFDYVSAGPGAVNATEAAGKLAEVVDATAKRSKGHKVDIVAHSLGNLVTKTCIVQGGCKNKVAHWSNFAGAQNGTALAANPELCPDPACADMAPGSALITALQAEDDTQIARQHVKVQVHWTPTDEIIIEPPLSKEPYADNVEVDGAITHLTISSDPGVLADTLTFLGNHKAAPAT
jgi:triacylglycerol lipase